MFILNGRFFLLSIILPCLIWDLSIRFSEAVRQGAVNASIMIMRYERDQDYGKAALWHEAAAVCLEIISRPMTEVTVKYYRYYGMDKLARLGAEELAQIDRQRGLHLRSAQLHWEKSVTDQTVIISEQNKIDQFFREWVSYYPDRFYDLSLCLNLFKKRQHLLLQKGHYAAALNLEADSAEMCADLYLKITIDYFKRQAKQSHRPDAYRSLMSQYEQVHDVHLQRAILLRQLAKKNGTVQSSDVAVREAKIPKTRTRLTGDQATSIAKSCLPVKSILDIHQGVRAYPWFQGFAWTVSFCNHGWGNLVTAIVDDKTGKVIDVLNQSEN